MPKKSQVAMNIQVRIKLRWRDAIKIRLAGFKNVKHLLKIEVEELKWEYSGESESENLESMHQDQ